MVKKKEENNVQHKLEVLYRTVIDDDEFVSCARASRQKVAMPTLTNGA